MKKCGRCGAALYQKMHDVEGWGTYDACSGCERSPLVCECGQVPASVIATDAVSAATAAPGPERFITGASFVLDAPTEVPSLWGEGSSVGWAPGEALMIVGGNGVGKTTLAHQLVAARLGILDTVLGWSVVPGEKRVLYLACDRPRQIGRAMGRLFSEEHRDVLDKRLVVWQGPPPYDFAKRTDLLAMMCRKADADTVVVDSLKDVAIGLSEDAVGSAYNRARQETIAAGVEVIELHHQKKSGANGGKPNTIADVYGSVWITAGAGSVILLWGEPGDPIVEMKHLKQPADEIGPHKVIHDHMRGISSIQGAVDLLQLATAFPHGMAPKAAALHLFDTNEPDRNQIEKARRKLDRLVKDGSLVAKEQPNPNGGKPQVLYHLATLRGISA